jgi:hypothetical protein
MSRRAVTVALTLLVVATLGLAPGGPVRAAEVVANTGSARIGFAAREWLDVGLDVNGVRIDRLRLHPPGGVKGLLTRHQEANRGRLVLTNGTDRNVKPAVAVAVFDADGHLLAAANTGLRNRTLRPGETEEMDIHFGGVFRHVERADYIYLSLEY